MDILSYFENRKIGCLDNSFLKGRGNGCTAGQSKTNINFLLPRLKCNWEDDHLTIGVSATDEQEFLVPAFASKFCPSVGKEHLLAIANEEGVLNILNTNFHSDASYSCTIEAHENAIFDVSWVPGESNLLTVSGDKTAALWDLQEEKKISSFKGHMATVKWVDFSPTDKYVFSTAGRDGCVIVWDSRTDKPDNIIKNCHAIPKPLSISHKKTKHLNSELDVITPDGMAGVTAVLFQDEYTLISTGSSDGNIKVWDIRKHYTTHKHLPLAKHVISCAQSHNSGYSSLLMDSSRRFLFASSCNNTIYQFNCSSYNCEPVATFTGHQNRTYFVKSALSPDDQYLLSGSSDYMAYIWAVSEPGEPIYKLEGHDGEVTAVSWSRDPVPRIATCGDDMRFKIWHCWPESLPIKSERPPTGRTTITPKMELITTKNTPISYRPRRLFSEPYRPNLSANTATPPKRVKRRIDRENLNGSTTPKKICSPFRTVLSPSKVTRNEENIRRKLAFDANEESPSKKIKCVTSPTINLPNSVVDKTWSATTTPKPRKRQSNWLSDISKPEIVHSSRLRCKKRKLDRKSPKNSKLSRVSQTLHRYFTSPTTPTTTTSNKKN